jgi:two-component sensor histidine kinase
MLRKILFLFCMLLFSALYGQEKTKIDSLQNEIEIFDQTKTKRKIISVTLADSVKTKLLIQLAKQYAESDPEKAIALTHQSLQLCLKMKYAKGVGLAYNTFARIYNSKADFKLAIAAATKAISINKELPDIENLGHSYSVLGQTYLYLNNFTSSLKYLNEAYTIFEKLGKHRKMVVVCNDLAILYGKLPNDQKQLEYYDKALKILDIKKSKKDEDLRFIIKGNLANVYSDHSEFDKANPILLQCIEYNEKNHLWPNATHDYQQLGINYGHMKQFDKALEYSNKALEGFIKTSNKSGEADSYRNIGEIYFLSDRLDLAETFTKKGLQLSTQIGELESVKFAYENLAKIYAKKGNFKEAYANHVLYKKISDSMFNAEINTKLTQIQLTNEFERKEEILRKQQQKRDEIHMLEANKQKKIKYVVLISLFLLSIVTASIYRNLKNYQKQRNIIQQQKEQIENSLLEKETLLREIHHRVKNNLQIISSLLNMQSNDINDNAVLAMIQEAQSRVEAMSLLHQNLYQSEAINTVDVENYLKQLVAYVAQMFEGDSKNIKIDIETFDLHFDFDTAISLGLIVNELVSNAYKYAFKNNPDGTIWIKIKSINAMDYELSVTDNGKGLPEDFDNENSKSLGLKLVGILSKQLRGKLTINTKNDLTEFVVIFKDLKAYQASIS